MPVDRDGEDLGTATAPGLVLDYAVPPTPLTGSNGLRIGPDGALYVAQANGGRIGRVDLDSGDVGVLPTSGGELIGPDDLAFDSRGNLFVTEVMGARVSARRPNGRLEVIAGDTPCANGITVHDDRIFMSEFNPQGRILELFADGTAPRTIATGVMMANALQLGPDGMLYFPQVVPGEVWRVGLDGEGLERVTGGLAMPTAVKFDRDGRLWAVEAPTGRLIRIELTSGDHAEVLRAPPGADNFEFQPDGTMLVSHFTDGEIVEVARDGATRQVVRAGMLGPFGVAAGSNGAILVADGSSIASIDRAGALTRVALMIEPGAPGYTRGIAVDADGAILVTNSAGQVCRFRPGAGTTCLAEGLDQAMGLAPDGRGGAYVCEAGAGRLLAVDARGGVTTVLRGLDRPADVAPLADGSLMVSEAGAGRLLHVRNGEAAVAIGGMRAPHGVCVTAEGVFVLDHAARALRLLPADRGPARVVASSLPVGGVLGFTESLPGLPGILPGPILPFGGLAALPDGRLAFAADAVGGVMTVAWGAPAR